MSRSDRIGPPRATLTGSPVAQTLRNGRLLASAALQHLVDDPALLAIQASRRLPIGPRLLIGRVFESASEVFPAIGALGAVMSGRDGKAEAILSRTRSGRAAPFSRLAGELAILLDRPDLLPANVPATTRARAAWSRGAMRASLAILEEGGAQETPYARRLRSEARLLEPDFRLPVPAGHGGRVPPPPAVGERLRVLHLLTNSLPHTQSGYTLRSHRILTSLRDQGVSSVALTRTGYPVMVGLPTVRDEDLIDGIRYVRTLPTRLPATQEERLAVETRRALELVEEFRPHVIHATTNYQNALVAQAVSEATGLPWVFEVRGLMEKTWVASRRSEEGRAQALRSEKHDRIASKEGSLAQEADAVVTLSRTMANEMISRGVGASSISLVPNGVEESLFEDHITSARARELVGLAGRSGYGEDALIAGAVSALVDYEGFDTLLRAVAVICHSENVPQSLRDRLHVVLAGDGAARPGLLALAEELGISDRVFLPGRVAREQARRWVEALDVVVVPRRDVSVTRLVTPQKPVEAMALGRPLIVSDLPALREIVTPSGSETPLAQLARPDDPGAWAKALQTALTDPDDAGSRLESAAQAARQRTWPQLMRRYDAVYEHVLKETAGGEGVGE